MACFYGLCHLLYFVSMIPRISTTISTTQLQVDRLPPASLTSRVNNRGPPRFTEIPFEAIPLEVLQSKIPGGGGKVQIQQRPFHTKRIKVAC